jgi:hypothetical protein
MLQPSQPQLKQIYLEQLMKVGVAQSKAEQAANNLTIQQLKMIGEIWEEWFLILNRSPDEPESSSHERHEKNFPHQG